MAAWMKRRIGSREQRDGSLRLEALERRCLLSGVMEGVDADGDVYQVRLMGPGAITDGSLEDLVVAGTTMRSRLWVTVGDLETGPVGDGQVDVASLRTSGSDLGRLEVEGNVGRLDAGRLGQMKVGSLAPGEGGTGLYTVDGDLGRLEVTGGINEATVTVSGDVGSLRVGGLRGAGGVEETDFIVGGSLGESRLGWLTGGSRLAVQGDARRVEVRGWVTLSEVEVGGDAGRITVRGGICSGSEVAAGGDVGMFRVRKTMSDSVMEVGGLISNAMFDNDLENSRVEAGMIERMMVRDDVDGSAVGVTGNIERLQVWDVRGLTLRVGGVLGDVQVRRDLEGALVAALGGIGRVQVGQDLIGSTLLGGIDIGEDFILDVLPGGDDVESGDVRIDQVYVRGDMVDSSIAAGVRPVGVYFGDGDDVAVAGDLGTAWIGRVMVSGEIGVTGQFGACYAITAADGMDMIRCQGGAFEGTADVAVQVL